MSFVDRMKERLAKTIPRGDGHILATTEVQETRISLCNGCDELFHFSRQCKKSLCFVDAKTKLNGAKCPLGKW